MVHVAVSTGVQGLPVRAARESCILNDAFNYFTWGLILLWLVLPVAGLKVGLLFLFLPQMLLMTAAFVLWGRAVTSALVGVGWILGVCWSQICS